MALSVALAVGVALLAALGWAILRGILDLGIGLLALAGVGGWAIGMLLRRIPRAPLAAVGLAALAWLLGLVLTWLIALAIRPGSSLTLPERLAGTPFLDWLAPQFGLFQVAGLVLYVIGAAYGARTSGAS